MRSRCGKGGNFAFHACFHVDPVDAEAVGGVGEAELELSGVLFCLRGSEGERGVAFFRLDHRQLAAFVNEDVVGDFRLRPLSGALQAAEGDLAIPFTENPAAFDDAPTGCFQGEVDEFGAGFGFVHGCCRVTLLRRA